MSLHSYSDKDVSLWPHQLNALDYCEEYENPALIMEMRTGKTRAVLAWVCRSIEKYNIKRPRVLILIDKPSPWERDCPLFGVEPVRGYNVSRQKRLKAIQTAWKECRPLLLNYDGLQVFPEIAELPWDFVIADESTKIKNPKSKTTMICNDPGFIRSNPDKYQKTGFRNSRFRAILTGQIMPERPEEVYSQMYFLDREFMGMKSFYAWRAKYFTKDNITGQWFTTPRQLEIIKKAFHDRSFVLRRKDLNIPETRIYEEVEFELNETQLEAMKELENLFSYSIPHDGTVYSAETDNVLVRNLWMQMICGGFIPGTSICINDSMISYLIELLKDEYKQQSVVIWVRFQEEWEFVLSSLRKAGLEVGGISGKITDMERRHKIEQLFQSGAIRVLVCTISSCNRAVEFSKAQTAIYYSNEYSGDYRAQSEDRIVSLSGTGTYEYIDLVHRGHISEEIAQIVKEKNVESKNFQRKYFPLKAIHDAYAEIKAGKQ